MTSGARRSRPILRSSSSKSRKPRLTVFGQHLVVVQRLDAAEHSSAALRWQPDRLFKRSPRAAGRSATSSGRPRRSRRPRPRGSWPEHRSGQWAARRWPPADPGPDAPGPELRICRPMIVGSEAVREPSSLTASLFSCPPPIHCRVRSRRQRRPPALHRQRHACGPGDCNRPPR